MKCARQSRSMDLAEKTTRSGKFFKDVDCFVNSEGDPIFCKYWHPESNILKGMLLLVHGFAEHCSRYEPFAQRLADKLDLLVFANDHAAHGENQGYFLDIVDYRQFIIDMMQHIEIMTTKHPSLPLYLFGHSMGGCLSVFLASEVSHLFKGVILSSPMLEPNREFTRMKVMLASALSAILPRLPVGRLDPDLISRNTKEVERYNDDPLVYSGPVRLRTGLQLYRMSTDVQECMAKVVAPLLILHGDDDQVCEISGSKKLVEVARSTNKELHVFPGARHELLHEIDNVPEEFICKVFEWLSQQMGV